MRAKNRTNHPQSLIDQYDEIIERLGNEEVFRKGASSAYTSHNGHMFSFITKEGGLAIRLSKEEHDKFMDEHGTEPVVQYNSVMNGYVAIPDEMFKNTATSGRYFKMGFDFVSTLDPK